MKPLAGYKVLRTGKDGGGRDVLLSRSRVHPVVYMPNEWTIAPARCGALAVFPRYKDAALSVVQNDRRYQIWECLYLPSISHLFYDPGTGRMDRGVWDWALGGTGMKWKPYFRGAAWASVVMAMKPASDVEVWWDGL